MRGRHRSPLAVVCAHSEVDALLCAQVEIEQCEFLLQSAVEAEDYAEADGLKQRIERLRSQHPIIPREERLAAALEDANYALAAIFQQDLEAVKTNLGLPKYV